MGCDVEGAMARMMDDEDFYLTCLGMLADDPGFQELSEALSRHDLAASFEAAHMLKGVIGNLGLTPMYQAVAKIVELLRAGQEAGTAEASAELIQLHGHLLRILRQS